MNQPPNLRNAPTRPPRVWPLVVGLSTYVSGIPKELAYLGVLGFLGFFVTLYVLFGGLTRRLRVPGVSWHFWIFAFVVATSQIGATLTGALTQYGAAQAAIYFAGLIGAYFVLASALAASWRRSMRLLAVTGTCLAGLAVYISLSGGLSIAGLSFQPAPFVIPRLGLRPTAGPFVDENYFAVVLFVCGLAALYLRTTSRHPPGRTAYTFAMALMGAGIVLTYSRAALATAAAAGLLWFSLGRPGRRLAIASTLAIAGLWLLLAVPIDDSVREILQIDRGLSGREQLWPIAVERIADRPWFGWGVGNVGAVLNQETKWVSSHNSLLDFVIMTGIPGGLAYIYFLLASLAPLGRRVEGAEIQRRFLICATLGVLLLAQFTTHTIGGLSFGSLTLTMLLGAANDWRWRTTPGAPTA